MNRLDESFSNKGFQKNLGKDNNGDIDYSKANISTFSGEIIVDDKKCENCGGTGIIGY